MFDILFFGCILDDLFANLTISTPIDYRINIFLSFHTSRQFQILHYPLKMFRKTKKKRKKNKRDGRFYKADGSANGIELEQTGSPYVSIMASQRRVGSTKHSARPVAEAHHLLNQTTQFQTDFIHAQIKMMSLDIKRKSLELQDLMKRREAFIKDAATLNKLMTTTHNRILSSGEQDAARQSRADWEERQQTIRDDLAAKSLENKKAIERLPSVKKKRIFPEASLEALSNLKEKTTTTPSSVSMTSKTPRSVRSAARGTLAVTGSFGMGMVKRQLEKMDIDANKSIPIQYDDLPINVYHYIIKSIVEYTKSGTQQRTQETKWWIQFLKDARWKPPSQSRLRLYVGEYTKEKDILSLPPKKKNNSTAPASVMALVLKDITKARSVGYAPCLSDVKTFLAAERAKHANSKGNAARPVSKSTENRQVKRLLNNTTSTSKSDNTTSSEKRYLARCWRNAVGNYYLRWMMIHGPRFGFDRLSCDRNPIQNCNYWNSDAMKIICGNGWDMDPQVFVEFFARDSKISGASKKGSHLPLSFSVHAHISAYGEYSVVYLCGLKSGLTIHKGKEMWPIILPTPGTNQNCIALIYDASLKGIGVKVALWVIDNQLIPDIIGARKRQGWKDGDDIGIMQHSVEMMDGEGDMMAAVQIRIDDGKLYFFIVDFSSRSIVKTKKRVYSVVFCCYLIDRWYVRI